MKKVVLKTHTVSVFNHYHLNDLQAARTKIFNFSTYIPLLCYRGYNTFTITSVIKKKLWTMK